jgi:hypothetical protein
MKFECNTQNMKNKITNAPQIFICSLLEIVDGIVGVASLGLCRTEFNMKFVNWYVLWSIKRMKKKRDKNE